MRPDIIRLAVLGCLLAAPTAAHAFCGFFVAKADTQLFNNASQVVLVRDEDKTVITMANDYKGPMEEFALVVPVPTFIEEGQIHVAERGLIDHLDAFTAPRLVEYHDPDPCFIPPPMPAMAKSTAAMDDGAKPKRASAGSLGVTIEAEYTVGEYDILILSAKESDGLETWLTQNDYKIPIGASAVLDGYIKQKMRFFVAKVNLDEQASSGYQNLRPLQVAYTSEKFMLPIRLGTVNAEGPQELFIYTLTRNGRVETTNYRTVKLPTGMDIPVHVKDEFGEFYTAMFDHQVEKEKMRVVFTEYAWNMSWCDPCAADPLSAQQLRELGVFWVDPDTRGQAQDAFVTRLHVRYDAETFPEDLVLQTTGDTQNFQGRYVLRHPFTGPAECDAGERYRAGLPERFRQEAQNLSALTGWSVEGIMEKQPQTGSTQAPSRPAEERSWWDKLWE